MQLCPVCETGNTEPFQTVGDLLYNRCPICQATLMEPECRLGAEDEKAVYALHDNNPDDPGYRRFLSRLADPLCKRLPPGASGLDFGCGPGPALAQMLEESGMQMRVYDPFFYPDKQPLAQRYDFITCTEVVEHLHNPARVFEQLDSLLRPGGLLGVMTCFQTDDARFANWHYRRDPTHVVFYRQLTLQWIASHQGWQLDIPAKDIVIFRKPVGPSEDR